MEPGHPLFDERVEALHMASIRMLRAARRMDSKSGLGPSQLGVLALLEESGPLPIGALARAERVAHPTMSRMVTSMERAGLVMKSPAPGDGRSQIVALTQKGAKARANANMLRRQMIETVVEQLKLETVDDLAATLLRTVQWLDGTD